jgi:hypothetical protein
MNTNRLGGNCLGRPGLEPGTNALKGQRFAIGVALHCYSIAIFKGVM